ncbi:MAG: MFS transporter [Armatimonadetes bacterium]|nr:MFS transporter [Armatimonadota bacterium]
MRTPRLPRTLGFLIAAGLVESCVGGSVLMTTFWLDVGFHAGARTTGLVLSIGTAVYLCSTILMGHLGDRVGTRRMTFLGAGLMALCTLGMVSVRTPWGLALPFAGRGLGAAMFWPSLAGWIGRGAGGAELHRRMAAYNIGWSSGSVVGSFLGGVAYQGLGPQRSLAWFTLGVVAAAMVILCLPALGAAAGADGAAGPPPSPRTDRWRAWLGMWVAFFVIASLRTHFPRYARLRYGFDPHDISACVVMLSASQMLVFLYLGVRRPRLALATWLARSQALAAVGLAALTTRWPTLGLLGLVAAGLNGGLAYTASIYHSLHGRADPARQGGINEMMVGSGSMLGAALGGLVAQQFGVAVTWRLDALLLLAALVAGMPRAAADHAK